jgi:chemotaxis protein MotB
MSAPKVALIPLALVLGGACVSSGTYRAKVSELDVWKRESAERESASKTRIAGLERDIAALQARLGASERRLHETSEERDEVRRYYDDSTALVGELQRRLQSLGQNVNRLMGDRGDLTAALQLARARLEELRRQAVAAEERAETFRHLVSKLHAMIDAGKLKVVVRQGRMLIALPSDILFDSGRTLVKPEARATLVEVAGALREVKDRNFLVVGHTDDVPIHTNRFPSNWELSAGRAIAVTHLLLESGLAPRALGIAGHGEFDPIAPNDGDENRSLNRRIEIVLEPNLSELPSIHVPAVSLAAPR